LLSLCWGPASARSCSDQPTCGCRGRAVWGAQSRAQLPAPFWRSKSTNVTRESKRGCFLAGIDDFTYGTPTALPWGNDFGDGVPRHPVQLYESATMLAAAVLYVRAALRHNEFVIANGFYLVVGFYGLQRFVWEFIKPYGTIVGPFTLFHCLSAALVAYALVMIATAPRRTADDRAFA
jgi:prolipoprotein diacylglyceryltransferase